MDVSLWNDRGKAIFLGFFHTGHIGKRYLDLIFAKQTGATDLQKSGGDATLSGAKVSGDKVKVDVGGDLTMTSLQDTSNYSSNQHNTGVRRRP